MANLINAERVSIAYGTRTLLAGVSLGLGRGDVIGVVGRNGDGKSTAAAAHPHRPDPTGHGPGRANRNAVDRLSGPGRRHRAAYSVRDVIVGGSADHSWAAEPALERSSSICLPESIWTQR